MDLHDQLRTQQEQEAQMSDELESLLNRFAEEYAVTKFQMASVLEQQKLRVLGFFQPSPDLLNLFDRLKETHGD
jgi:hypothetical protein